MKITRDWLNDYLDHPASTEDIVATLGRLGFPIEDVENLPDGDARLDVEVTSNRGDCLSVIGLAREFVAGNPEFKLRLPTVNVGDSGAAATVGHPSEHFHAPLSGNSVTVENRDHGLCPYYSGRVLRGLKVGPSPDWLRARIEGVGLRSVNNVVDITNFVLFELGQPLHAFDLSTIRGGRIIIRRATNKEPITAIDGSTLSLLPDDLVIADAVGPVAVAGVMGGLDSEVGDLTADILLEAAVFHPMSVRSTARRLRLMTDSSHRFERGIHPASVPFAAERAVELIQKVAGGVREPGVAEDGDLARVQQPAPMMVEMRAERCRLLLGEPIPVDEMKASLAALNLCPAVVMPDATVAATPAGPSPAAGTALAAGVGRGDDSGQSVLVCTIPFHRLDLEREVDLIEEVARMHGLDNIPTRAKIDIEVAPIQVDVANRRAVEEALTACGFHEVVTFSFVSVADAEVFLPAGFSLLTVSDDRRKAEPVLRPSLLPSLLRCRKRNQDLGHREVRLFEQAVCYWLKGDAKAEESNLSFILDAPDRQQGLRLLRTAIDRAVCAIQGHAAHIEVRPVNVPWFEEGASGSVFVNGMVLGTMGALSGTIQDRFDLQTPVCAAELALGDLLFAAPPTAQVQEIPSQPSIERDLSVVIDEPIAWSKVRDVIDHVEHPHLVAVDFVGVYRGKQVGAGRKSLTLRLTYRAADRTLRHDEVTPHVDQIVERLARETGASLRT